MHAGIDRVFHGHRVSGFDQDPLQEVNRLLAAVGHDDVVPVTGRAVAVSLLEQIAAQGRVTGRRAQLQDLDAVGGDHFFSSGADLLERKQFLGRPRGSEADRHARSGQRRRMRGLNLAFHEDVPPAKSGRPRRRDTLDETAAADMAADEALGLQQFVGCGYGGPVQTNCASQFPGGWQPVASCQLAGFNRVFEMAV